MHKVAKKTCNACEDINSAFRFFYFALTPVEASHTSTSMSYYYPARGNARFSRTCDEREKERGISAEKFTS